MKKISFILMFILGLNVQAQEEGIPKEVAPVLEATQVEVKKETEVNLAEELKETEEKVVALKKQMREYVGLEDHIIGISALLLGTEVYYDKKIAEEWTLRPSLSMKKVGLEEVLYTGSFGINTRLYYNIERRNGEKIEKSGEIKLNNNAFNFVELGLSYEMGLSSEMRTVEDYFGASHVVELKYANRLTFAPSWGIRRTLGNHFNFETGVTMGVSYLLEDQHSTFMLSSYEKGKFVSVFKLNVSIGVNL